MWIFTENPWPLTILFGVVGAAALYSWMRSGQKQRLLHAGVCAGLIGLVFLIDYLVVTDREAVQNQLDELVAAVVSGDADRAVDFVSSDEQAARDLIRRGLNEVNVSDDLRIKDVQITIKAGEARCHFRANGSVDIQRMGITGRHVATRWELTWQQRDDDWQVTRVKRLNPVNGDEVEVWSSGQ